MRVLVIPEDFRKDQLVLKPIVEAMMRHLGRRQAYVEVLKDPLLQGVARALDWDEIRDILEANRGMFNLFLLCVDRDGLATRRAELDHLERRAGPALDEGRLFLAENAWQEPEVWVLAGHDLPPEWRWTKVRAEVNPKEAYFMPFARERGCLREVGQGRRTLALEAARRYSRIRQLCPEDVRNLEARIRVWLRGSP